MDDLAFENADGEERRFAWDWEEPEHVRVRIFGVIEKEDEEEEKELASFKIRSRFHGNYGGSEIVLSRTKNFIALFMYSGQSEQGYELFWVGAEPKRIAGVPFEIGSGGPPIFGPDDEHIAMLNCRAGDIHVRSDEDEPMSVYIGALFHQDLSEAEDDPGLADNVDDMMSLDRRDRPETAELLTTLPEDTLHDPEEWYSTPEEARFLAWNKLEITLPWEKKVVIDLPASDEEEVPPPDEDWVDPN